MASKSTFNAKQYDDAYPEGISFHYWQLARVSVVAKTLFDLGMADAKVLEVGCGKGVVINALRKKGVAAYGVELANVEIDKELEKYVSVGIDACDLPLVERQMFDVILLLDVIEHVRESETFIQNLILAFPNLKRIIVTVPARQEIWSQFDDYYGHYRRYNLDSVRLLSSDLGLELNGERYFFHSLYFMALMSRFFKLARSTAINAPSGYMRTFHCIFARILELEYLLKLKNIYGSSIVFTLNNKKFS